MSRVYLVSFIALMFLGCKKNEVDLNFDKLPEERISEGISELRSTLITASNGWIGIIDTKEAGAYGLYLNFKEDETLEMLMDGNTDALDELEGASELMKSTYRIKHVMSTSLLFDTYNYISVLQDPDPDMAGGAPGKGLQSDVDFELVTYSENKDTIHLKGKRYGKRLVLYKASADEKASYIDGKFEDNINKNINFFKLNPFTTFTIDGIVRELSVNFGTKKVSALGINQDGTFNNQSVNFANVIGGIFLVDPIMFGNIKIISLRWNGEILEAIDSSGAQHPISINSSSIVPYLDVLGAGFSTISVPNAETFEGWGSDFIVRRALTRTRLSGWNVSNQPLILSTINFTFQVLNNRMNVNANLLIGTTGQILTLSYTYSYVLKDGAFKFTLAAQPGGNSGALYNDMRALLQERIEKDNFILDYFVNKNTGVVMSQIKSVENPTFIITGNNN